MPKSNAALLALNRGIVSKNALARVDVDRVRLSAEVMENFLPKTQGSMFLRPGFGKIGESLNQAFAIDIPFVAATDDTALIELADGKMRVRVDDELITRVAVTTAITTSNFSSATGWTEANTGGGDCTFGGSGLTLNATNIGGLALVRQEVTCSGGNIGLRHALNINVTRGPVTFRCGSASGGDQYISETTLRTGAHSLAFTPAGNFWVQFENDKDVDRIVASCQVASVGTMELDIPFAAADLPFVRYDQSADVIFLACDGYQQRRIERRAEDSWSIVLYTSDTGPFLGTRSAAVKLKAGATTGNTTLTSDKPFFTTSHVGALFRLFTPGYDWTFKLGAEDTFTPPVRVTGITVDGEYSDRYWAYTISGTWAGSIWNQRSFDSADTGYLDWRNAHGGTLAARTSNVSDAVQLDNDSNAVIYYRLGFKPGDYTSGVATINIKYNGGGEYGVCRVIGYSSPTQVTVEVLEPFSTTQFTDNWQEGIWSPKRGYPGCVTLDKGRLWWPGKARFIGSVSDDYENFDPDYEGDAGPINRTLGSGPVDEINFSLSLGRLIIGTPGAEFSIKSTSFDEPLTPQNTQAGTPSTQGSRKGVNAVKIDNRGVFSQRSGKRLFELIFNSESYDYEPRDLTLLCPDLTGSASVVGMVVQRQTDTRVHVWLDDGTVVLLTYEPSEEVVCWSRIAVGGNGFVEHVSVLPGEDEDQVFYRVRRTINSLTKRYLEKMALESECLGGDMHKQADSFIVVASVTGTSVTGLSHLEGKGVVVWGGGSYLGAYIVTGGAITLGAAVTALDLMVGLPFTAYFKSTKLAYSAAAGTALGQRKKVNYIGAIMRNTHNDGLYYGPDFDHLDPLPRMIAGVESTSDQIFDEFDEPAFEFPGDWNTDSRLCLKATAPKPVEVLAAILSVETNDRV